MQYLNEGRGGQCGECREGPFDQFEMAVTQRIDVLQFLFHDAPPGAA